MLSILSPSCLISYFIIPQKAPSSVENDQNIDLKVCGITSSDSIITAANNNIRSLGFASNNLYGPNTCDDDLIKNLIEECDEYKIESVLLSRYHSAYDLVKQIDYTKPKIISCSYFYG